MKKKIIYSISAGITALLFYLFYLFISDITNYKDDYSTAGAIVVLTGGMGRVEEGASLLLAERAKYLIISGVNRESDLKSIFFTIGLDIDSSRVILENNSKSTYENAVEAGKIIKDKNFRDIILVTSKYHMKRALYVFRSVIPPDVKINPHPVSTSNFDEKHWWKNTTSIRIIFFEFIKFYWYRVWI
ncbi:MAG: hypothetical protein A2073_05535 [Deltaproteobacteria bacterium GWC2_42_11]|nr:MAG: hypothetical protein A2073_05535 [Deltaproteobacteria bacterium GWC2_42_11]